MTEIDGVRAPSPTPRRALAVSAGKATRWLSRQMGKGGGTTLPGLVAERVDPKALHDLAASVPRGCVFVTGTNGKTTTTRILVDALRRSGLEPLTNREGSNLLHGLGTTLLVHAGAFGTLRVGDDAIGVFEVDEGHLLPAIEAVQPRLVVITNLLRDQLDRYFEIDWVAQLWKQALAKLPPASTVVLNADDPQVARLGEDLPNPVIYYGLDDPDQGQEALEHTSDSRRCLHCGADLAYTRVYYAHLGHYRCPGCGWERPVPSVSARHLNLRGMDGSSLEVESPNGTVELELPLGGLHNAYNALVAVATASALDVAAAPVRQAVAEARSPFGRLERFTMDGHDVWLALVKNPSGYNETLRLITSGEGGKKGLVLAINDQIQDGRDVSWIWDVDFERCRDGIDFVLCAGRRAHDMSVRLKYAGLFEQPGGPELVIEQDVLKAFEVALARTPAGGPLFVLPTYTAMWTLRETLARSGHVQPFWRS